MAKSDLVDYLTDKNGNISLMNFIDLKSEITANDYEEVVISDYYKFRVDLLAQDLLGNNMYAFLIVMLNSITDINDLDSGKTIKIPTTTFIENNYNRLKKEVLA
jgi:hypothetical protein